MKRITILMTFLLLCGLLSGCIFGAAEGETTQPTTMPTGEAVEIPEGTVPFVTPTLPIELIPKSTDDGHYELPPGEKPTIDIQVQ